jgi:mediator of RNA polymerase II transcription subunit 24
MLSHLQGNYGPLSLNQPDALVQAKPFMTKESEAKNLIIRAWRERWTDRQWGIHVRKVSLPFISIILEVRTFNPWNPCFLIPEFWVNGINLFVFFQLLGSFDSDTDLSFIADCILQQALNGPGPNNLVLSYLKHTVFSQVFCNCN